MSTFERVALADAAGTQDRRSGGRGRAGKMELASAAFREAIAELLGRDVAVVATVHVGHHPLTDARKRRPDIRVVRVTDSTSDALPPQLMAWLVGAQGGEDR
jgi:nucleoside-triphosphatase THEP1